MTGSESDNFLNLLKEEGHAKIITNLPCCTPHKLTFSLPTQFETRTISLYPGIILFMDLVPHRIRDRISCRRDILQRVLSRK